ncbi:MAG: FAD-dependent oxidoreductase [Deltaproteobacteria bacterium]|nr:FAD-dependent oxidoreductase [Deltaproteobacteria bacterium]MBW2070398.1 FAD-dependent oxidoreductase [Deltaproteobacteria bacterium]
MITAGLAIGGLGLLAGVGLAIASKVFYVYIDPKVEELEEALPGANCGGCGMPGCSAAAQAIVLGKLAPNCCVGGGPEVHARVAEILGVEVEEREPQIAHIGCRYSVQEADLKYIYDGVDDCRAAVLLAGGPKECPIGCIGLGSCVKACPFEALSMGDDGLPVVDEHLCTGCGTCVRTCPKGIIALTSVTDRILGEYTTDECTAPCQRTCPAGINIPEQIRQTALGNYREALRIIKERNPLPMVCGRICPHPCEFECRRNLHDEPVAINYLKRFVADHERQSGERIELFKAPDTGKRLAVVGGGAEGLSTACFLARLGHSPTIFEAMPELGGLLRKAIAESRLPRDVIDWDINGILELGVEARTGQVLGRDFTIAGLLEQDYQAVILATGGWDAILMRNSGLEQPVPGLYLLLPLSLALAQGTQVQLGKRVVIVGGGEMALDLARKCRGIGAESVDIIFERPQAQLGLSDSDLAKMAEESVSLHFQTTLTRLLGEENRLTHLALTTVPSGNGTARPVRSKESLIAADTIIAAIGRLPEMIFVRVPTGEDEGSPIRWRTISPYHHVPRPVRQEVFTSVDTVTDYRSVVEAIGAGRRAAASTHLFLTGKEVLPPPHMITPDTDVLDVSRLVALQPAAPRQKMPERPAEELVDPSLEIELGLTEEMALTEAARCLNCGLICYLRSRYH